MKLKEADIDNLNQVIIDQKKEIQGYSDAVTAFNTKISRVEEHNNSLKYEIEMHKRNEDLSQVKISEMTEELSSMKERLKEQRHELSIVQKEFEQTNAKTT